MKKIISSLLAVILFTSCATMQTHTSERTTQKLTLNTTLKDAYSLAFKTALEMRWTIINSDTDMHSFSAKTPGELSRWEDEVNVIVENINDNSVITVLSNLGHEPNRKYIESYIESIKRKFIK
jgi:hypothetical protein